jgi:hypothetical protein
MYKKGKNKQAFLCTSPTKTKRVEVRFTLIQVLGILQSCLTYRRRGPDAGTPLATASTYEGLVLNAEMHRIKNVVIPKTFLFCFSSKTKTWSGRVRKGTIATNKL